MNRSIRILPSLVAAAGVAFGAHDVAAAAKLKVPSPAFPTIQSAVDAAGAGDVVLIHAGVYFENVKIQNKTDITLKGGKGVVIDARPSSGQKTGPAIEASQCGTVRIENVTVRHAEWSSAYAAGVLLDPVDDAFLKNVVAEHCVGPGIDVNADNVIQASKCSVLGCEGGAAFGGADVRLDKVSVRDDMLLGIRVLGLDAVVKNCTVERIGAGQGIDCQTIDGEITKCVVRDVQGVGIRSGCFDTVIGACTLERAGGVEGAVLVDGQQATLFKVVVRDAPFSGIVLTGSVDEGVLVANTVERCGITGIDVGYSIGGDDLFVLGNKAREIDGRGFGVLSTSTTFAENQATGCVKDGFRVIAGSNSVTFIENKALGNHAEGFHNAGLYSGFLQNLAQKNRIDFADEGANTALSQNKFGSVGAPELD